MSSTGFLRVLGGAFNALARGLTTLPALPAPEPESDGDGAAHALVPIDVNKLVNTDGWHCVKEMVVNSKRMPGTLDEAIKNQVTTWASTGLAKQRYLVPKGSHCRSWEYLCCSRWKGCPYRAKAVLERGPSGEVLRIFQRGEHLNHGRGGSGLPSEERYVAVPAA